MKVFIKKYAQLIKSFIQYNQSQMQNMEFIYKYYNRLGVYGFQPMCHRLDLKYGFVNEITPYGKILRYLLKNGTIYIMVL
jgi:hypothetical protein